MLVTMKRYNGQLYSNENTENENGIILLIRNKKKKEIISKRKLNYFEQPMLIYKEEPLNYEYLFLFTKLNPFVYDEKPTEKDMK